MVSLYGGQDHFNLWPVRAPGSQPIYSYFTRHYGFLGIFLGPLKVKCSALVGLAFRRRLTGMAK